MTPEAFVEMVAPHLPIGPYERVRSVSPCDVELVDLRGRASRVSVDDGAHALIGVVAWKCPAITLTRVKADHWMCRIGNTRPSSFANGAGPPGALRAVLEAWEAYMTPIRPRPMMPNPDTEPKR